MLFSQISDAAQPAMFRIPLSPEYEIASVQHRNTVLQARRGSSQAGNLENTGLIKLWKGHCKS